MKVTGNEDQRMVQKAILQIDRGRGAGNSALSGGRFQVQNSVTAAAAERLRQGATAALQQADMVQNGTVIRDSMITVQYNPASIKYHASSSARKEQEMEAGSTTRKVTSILRKSTVDISFDLVFHSTDDDDESVREQMELVMNMIYDSPTRYVRFAWGELMIEGKLTGFSGEYNMFDTTGRPVSGRMSLTVRTVSPVDQVDKVINEIGKERKDKLATQDI